MLLLLLLSGQAEPTITLNLVPADAAGTTFNLTPVLNSSSGEQYAPPPASSVPHTPGLSSGGLGGGLHFFPFFRLRFGLGALNCYFCKLNLKMGSKLF